MSEQNINQLNNTTSPETDEISLNELIQKIKEWVAYLKTKWKIVFLAGVLGAAIGLVFALFQKPTYKAVLTFALEEEKGSGDGLGAAMGLASSFGIDLGSSGGGAFVGSNLVALMKSRLLVEKTLLNPVIVNGDTISLVEYYIQINELRDKWSEKSASRSSHASRALSAWPTDKATYLASRGGTALPICLYCELILPTNW